MRRGQWCKVKTELYRGIDISARVGSATPYELISLLYEGLLTSLADARLALDSGDLEAKSRCLTKAISIVHALRESLNTDIESDLPHNVLLLYNYMIDRLLQASRECDTAAVVEVSELVLTIKSGWDRIRPE